MTDVGRGRCALRVSATTSTRVTNGESWTVNFLINYRQRVVVVDDEERGG